MFWRSQSVLIRLAVDYRLTNEIEAGIYSLSGRQKTWRIGMEHLAQEIIHFWFGELNGEGLAKPEFRRRWFAKDESFDKQLISRFMNFMEPAGMGAFDRWIKQPEGRVALIVLLDQFPRNMFRAQARAFYYDAKALAIAWEGIEKKEFLSLPTSLAYFSLMPTMHAENEAVQDIGVSAFAELAGKNHGEAREMIEGALRYAEAHRDIIKRFGRFPHRNAILGRTSTAEEEAFLTEPGSSF